MSVPHVIVVHAAACHFCADALEALAEIGCRFPMRVDLVEADSARGLALVAAYRPGMFPLVLLDGALFSSGRLPRRKLHARLSSRPAVSTR